MSRYKRLLRVVEWWAMLGALASLVLVLGVRFGAWPAAAAEPELDVLFGGMFPVASIAGLLVAEQLTVINPDRSLLQVSYDADELDYAVRFCPRPLLYACVGTVILLLSWMAVASLEHLEFLDGKVIGLGRAEALVYALSIPVLASARRMHGTYAEQE